MNDLEKYVDIKKGSIPLILSVPHGGSMECENIPIRESGLFGTDRNTIELAFQLISEIKKISQIKLSHAKEPAYIILKARRSKIDLNRDEHIAFSKNSQLAKAIYRFYHSKLNELIISNIEQFNRSLLIDIHGFEKDKRPEGYRDVEIVIGSDNLKSLFHEAVPKKEWSKNIRGELIKRFIDLGIEIAAGHPKRKEYVLTGGLIAQKYGASQIPKSQALQLEFSDTIRYQDMELRNLVISTIAEILCENIF
jgi:hypothetical protein